MVHMKHDDKPLVIIRLEGENAFWHAFFEMAREFEWQVHDLNLDKGFLDPDFRPKGAVLREFADSPLVTQLRELGCACIRTGSHPHPLDSQMSAILPDYDAAGRMAIKHFSSRGIKHVRHVVNEPRDEFNQMADIMMREADRLGMEFGELSKPRSEKLDAVMEDMLKGLSKPIGIFGAPVYMLRMVRFAPQFGWRVPEDLAVLSPTDSLQCEASIVPVSAIEQDYVAQGRLAALTLRRSMGGEECPDQTYVPPKGVILRQSTDLIAVSDALVSQALQYIWGHYDWPLTVEDVATEVQVSRSTLQRRFRQYLGRTVNDEIRRKRLEECAKLLKNSSISLADIATRVGLHNRGYLHRAFVEAYGMTPGQYRSG